MLADLERSHHVKERELLADVEALLNKILVVHYEHHGEELSSIHHHFALLKADLEEHFAKEEKLVFPIMKKSGKPSSEDIAYVKSLEEEHSTAGDLIKLLQKETNFFTAPEDVCPTYRRCFSQMETLVEDIFMHIFKENSIAFSGVLRAGIKKLLRCSRGLYSGHAPANFACVTVLTSSFALLAFSKY